MAYLIVDPVGRYPAEMMPFLARQLNQGAVAVFSSRSRLALWQGKWSKQVGDNVLDTYLAPGAPSVAVSPPRSAPAGPSCSASSPGTRRACSSAPRSPRSSAWAGTRGG